MNNLFDKSTLAKLSARASKFRDKNDACMKIQFKVSKEVLNEVGR